MTTCSACSTKVPVTTAYRYPDGERRQVQTHAGQNGAVICPGSLTDLP